MSNRPGVSAVPIVELKNVVKSYRLGEVVITAVKKANLQLHLGEFTALIGASGSGKSTLLNIIGCIDQADSGIVTIGGSDVKQLSDNEKSDLRNQKIGFIFQNFNLIPVLDVYENVELPLLVNGTVESARERNDRVLEAINDVELSSVIHHRPDQLSGGQRQRVAIARALAGRPSLVLADEPTANLDSETSSKIIDLMIALNEKKKVTFLFSTHDERLMSRVKRIIHIKDGLLDSDSGPAHESGT